MPFLFTKDVLSTEGFNVLPPLLRVSFSQTVHFAAIIRALRCFDSALDSIPPHSKHQRMLFIKVMNDELFSDYSRGRQEILMCLAAHSQYFSPVAIFAR